MQQLLGKQQGLEGSLNQLAKGASHKPLRKASNKLTLP